MVEFQSRSIGWGRIRIRPLDITFATVYLLLCHAASFAALKVMPYCSPPYNSPSGPSPPSLARVCPIYSHVLPSISARLLDCRPPSATLTLTGCPSDYLLLDLLMADAWLTAPDSFSGGLTLESSPPLAFVSGITWKWVGGASWRRRPSP